MLILANLNLGRMAYYEVKERRRHNIDAERLGGIEVTTNARGPRSSGRELSQELFEGLFPRSIGGRNGFIKDR